MSPGSVLYFPAHISHALARDRTRASNLTLKRLTAAVRPATCLDYLQEVCPYVTQ